MARGILKDRQVAPVLHDTDCNGKLYRIPFLQPIHLRDGDTPACARMGHVIKSMAFSPLPTVSVLDLHKYRVAGCDTFWELILRAEVLYLVLNIMWDLMHLFALVVLMFYCSKDATIF